MDPRQEITEALSRLKQAHATESKQLSELEEKGVSAPSLESSHDSLTEIIEATEEYLSNYVPPP